MYEDWNEYDFPPSAGSQHGCIFCGWSPECMDSHIEESLWRRGGCRYIESKYETWLDDDGETCWRRRDFLWVIPKLVAWKNRAIERVQREYAIDGPRGQRCLAEFERDFGTSDEPRASAEISLK